MKCDGNILPVSKRKLIVEIGSVRLRFRKLGHVTHVRYTGAQDQRTKSFLCALLQNY